MMDAQPSQLESLKIAVTVSELTLRFSVAPHRDEHTTCTEFAISIAVNCDYLAIKHVAVLVTQQALIYSSKFELCYPFAELAKD